MLSPCSPLGSIFLFKRFGVGLCWGVFHPLAYSSNDCNSRVRARPPPGARYAILVSHVGWHPGLPSQAHELGAGAEAKQPALQLVDSGCQRSEDWVTGCAYKGNAAAFLLGVKLLQRARIEPPLAPPHFRPEGKLSEDWGVNTAHPG